ncbi:MAG: ankyrin repeat domain-containing protein [Chitinophagaceae bacterium]|nr:ankyrin repeat domain-containing protein [Chitinophagaceae bacterium]
MIDMKQLINSKDYEAIRKALATDPTLANEEIAFDDDNTTKAHPLHRISDGVFAHTFTDREGVELARIFLEYGANVNGNKLTEGQDSPLTAAASLHAEELAIFLIDNGADIHHKGFFGGTALHWAAWVGRDKLVERLISEKAAIDQICITHKGTPLLWAVHGYKYGGAENRHHQVDCVRLLLDAGADKTIPNIEGTTALAFLDEEDTELLGLLR